MLPDNSDEYEDKDEYLDALETKYQKLFAETNRLYATSENR